MTTLVRPSHPRLRVRFVPPGAPAAQLEILVALAGTLLPLALWLAPIDLLAGLTGGCSFHGLTGLPCPTCGTTRGFVALAHGHLLEALRMNPLLFGFLLAVEAWTPVAWILWLARLPRPRLALEGTGSRLLIAVTVLVAVLANWAFLVADGR